MRSRGAIVAVVLSMVVAGASGGCGGGGSGNSGSGNSGGGTSGSGKNGKKGRTIETRVRSQAPIVVVDGATECRFDGARQYTAKGIVRNAGDKSHHVSIAVRFVDGNGVRVDLASDSVSDLEPGESAQWHASISNDDGSTVQACEVSTEAS